jgi:hypothetical protein
MKVVWRCLNGDGATWRRLNGDVSAHGVAHRKGVVRVAIERVQKKTGIRSVVTMKSEASYDQIVKLLGRGVNEMHTLRSQEVIRLWLEDGQTLTSAYTSMKK